MSGWERLHQFLLLLWWLSLWSLAWEQNACPRLQNRLLLPNILPNSLWPLQRCLLDWISVSLKMLCKMLGLSSSNICKSSVNSPSATSGSINLWEKSVRLDLDVLVLNVSLTVLYFIVLYFNCAVFYLLKDLNLGRMITVILHWCQLNIASNLSFNCNISIMLASLLQLWYNFRLVSLWLKQNIIICKEK